MCRYYESWSCRYRYHALVHCGQLQPGETALIHGATGATGLAAVDIAAAIGARCIVTGGSDEKLAVVADVGGEACVVGRHNYRSGGGFKGLVRELTGGKGADLVYVA